jgi:hypothetical protein
MSDSWTPPINPAAGTSVRPKEVDLAFWILVVWSIVGVITAVVTVSSGGMDAEMQRQMAASGASMDPGMASTVTGAASIGAVIGAVVGAVLWIFFGVMMRGGRNWARIVLTVFGAISILFNLVATFTGPTPILSVLGVLVTAAVIVLMYRPAANPYFAPRPAVG